MAAYREFRATRAGYGAEHVEPQSSRCQIEQVLILALEAMLNHELEYGLRRRRQAVPVDESDIRQRNLNFRFPGAQPGGIVDGAQELIVQLDELGFGRGNGGPGACRCRAQARALAEQVKRLLQVGQIDAARRKVVTDLPFVHPGKVFEELRIAPLECACTFKLLLGARPFVGARISLPLGPLGHAVVAQESQPACPCLKQAGTGQGQK